MLQEQAPTGERVGEAYDELATHSLPGTPPLWAIRVLRQVCAPPWNVGERRIVTADITEGNVLHGEMRSDDHIGKYEVIYPADEECGECGNDTRFYRYSAHHNIAGHETILCRNCESVLKKEEWG